MLVHYWMTSRKVWRAFEFQFWNPTDSATLRFRRTLHGLSDNKIYFDLVFTSSLGGIVRTGEVRVNFGEPDYLDWSQFIGNVELDTGDGEVLYQDLVGRVRRGNYPVFSRTRSRFGNSAHNPMIWVVQDHMRIALEVIARNRGLR